MNYGRPLDVLLADPSRVVRRLVGDILADDTHVRLLGSFASGAETLRAADSVRPDVLVLDEELSDGSGLSVAESLRERWPELTVIWLGSRDARAESAGSRWVERPNATMTRSEAISQVRTDLLGAIQSIYDTRVVAPANDYVFQDESLPAVAEMPPVESVRAEDMSLESVRVEERPVDEVLIDDVFAVSEPPVSAAPVSAGDPYTFSVDAALGSIRPVVAPSGTPPAATSTISLVPLDAVHSVPPSSPPSLAASLPPSSPPSLPPSSPPSSPPLSIPFPSVPPMPRRVLIVDDSKPIRMMLKNALKEAGVESFEASSVAELQASLASGEVFAIVVIGCGRAIAVGEAVDAVKAAPHLPRTKILLAGTDADAERVAEGVAHGAHDKLAKPFNKDSVFEKLAALSVW